MTDVICTCNFCGKTDVQATIILRQGESAICGECVAQAVTAIIGAHARLFAAITNIEEMKK